MVVLWPWHYSLDVMCDVFVTVEVYLIIKRIIFTIKYFHTTTTSSTGTSFTPSKLIKKSPLSIKLQTNLSVPKHNTYPPRIKNIPFPIRTSFTSTISKKRFDPSNNISIKKNSEIKKNNTFKFYSSSSKYYQNSTGKEVRSIQKL